MKKVCLTLIFCFLISISDSILYARILEPNSNAKKTPVTTTTGCAPSSSQADLDIGNVRARILMNGDMWWDLIGSAQYEVPKGSGKHSLFTGAFWVGGKDLNGNVELAAQMYRQSGPDFWPGALDTTTCNINSTRCNFYDHHWKITKQEVLDFINGGSPSTSIVTWPGNGDPAYQEDHYLAPFEDVNGDGLYRISDGDYPKYNLNPGGGSGSCQSYLQGDQTIWWIFNDKGNSHTESGGNPIGLEIQAQAFAFSTADTNLSNTTFYQYKVINRCGLSLYNCWFGQYVDADLGYFDDDYVGCDVGRNLGYFYNGDADDDLPGGYGLNPPAVGVVNLHGPFADVMDGIDNDHDSTIDEPYEETLFSTFIVFENSASVQGYPTSTLHYYNYLHGVWKDGSTLVYGGTGYQTPGGDTCSYMFPDNSDPYGWGTRGVPLSQLFPWSESNPTNGGVPNSPGDRRFLMSSGPFTMLPGAVEFYTRAAVWARASTGGPLASLALLKSATDEIQSFFDSCYTGIPTGINTINMELSSTVFPNPANNAVTITLLNTKSRIEKFRLFDLNGKTILEFSGVMNGTIHLNTSELSPGIYFYSIQVEKGKRANGKFIISTR